MVKCNGNAKSDNVKTVIGQSHSGLRCCTFLWLHAWIVPVWAPQRKLPKSPFSCWFSLGFLDHVTYGIYASSLPHLSLHIQIVIARCYTDLSSLWPLECWQSLFSWKDPDLQLLQLFLVMHGNKVGYFSVVKLRQIDYCNSLSLLQIEKGVSHELKSRLTAEVWNIHQRNKDFIVTTSNDLLKLS